MRAVVAVPMADPQLEVHWVPDPGFLYPRFPYPIPPPYPYPTRFLRGRAVVGVGFTCGPLAAALGGAVAPGTRSSRQRFPFCLCQVADWKNAFLLLVLLCRRRRGGGEGFEGEEIKVIEQSWKTIDNTLSF